jgi:hypothetical protein
MDELSPRRSVVIRICRWRFVIQEVLRFERSGNSLKLHGRLVKVETDRQVVGA